jgi:hypothetical protein
MGLGRSTLTKIAAKHPHSVRLFVDVQYISLESSSWHCVHLSRMTVADTLTLTHYHLSRGCQLAVRSLLYINR